VMLAATTGWIDGDTPVGSLIKSSGDHVCYYLDSTEIRTFCDFRDRIEYELEQIRCELRMGVALDHLMSSFSVRQPATHVVDLFICLEALLKYSPEETIFSLSKRVANFVGDSGSERKEVSEKVRSWYGLRCAIVHGATLRPEHEQLLGNVSELRELVRKVFLVATALGGRVGFGPEYYKSADDLGRDVSLKRKVIQEAFSEAAVAQ